jgi:hypothetical protein
MSMLGISGAHVSLHIIEFPSGRFGYVGSIPTDICEQVPADRTAILGQRAFSDPETGCSMMWTFPSFETVEGAIAHAKDRGHSPMWKNEAQ